MARVGEESPLESLFSAAATPASSPFVREETYGSRPARGHIAPMISQPPATPQIRISHSAIDSDTARVFPGRAIASL